MVELKTVIEEFRSGRIEFDYKSDDCCTTPGELLILLGRLAELEERIDKGEILEAPCNKGDTVFWVDALNHIKPVKVSEFTLGVKDDKGYYYSHFGSSIQLSEEEAKHQIELNYIHACEECYKDCVRCNVKSRCEKGRSCSKISFKEKYAEKWRAEALEADELENKAYCKFCYIKAVKDGKEPKCAPCSGKHIVDKYRDEWDAEIMKEAK